MEKKCKGTSEKCFQKPFRNQLIFFFLLICCKLKCDQFLENKIKYQVHINAYQLNHFFKEAKQKYYSFSVRKENNSMKALVISQKNKWLYSNINTTVTTAVNIITYLLCARHCTKHFICSLI